MTPMNAQRLRERRRERRAAEMERTLREMLLNALKQESPGRTIAPTEEPVFISGFAAKLDAAKLDIDRYTALVREYERRLSQVATEFTPEPNGGKIDPGPSGIDWTKT